MVLDQLLRNAAWSITSCRSITWVNWKK